MSTQLLQPGWRTTRTRINGVEFHLVEAGREGDRLLVLLHGFPEFWWAWRKQITPLAEAGFHVVVPDLRGYNESEAPPGISSYRLDVLAADVAAIGDAYGATSFDLVAHDWGAVIGWWFAACYPDRLGKAVLMNGPHPKVMAEQARRHPTQALRSAYVGFFQMPRLPETVLSAFRFAALRSMLRASARPGAFEAGALDRYAEAWAHPGSLTAMLNYYRALRMKPQGPRPKRIAPPVLVLWGARDRFLELHVAEASLALCDRGRLDVLDEATHWLHLEMPEVVNGRTIDFLREADASPTERSGTR